MSYSLWGKYKQPQKRPWDLRWGTSGGEGQEDVMMISEGNTTLWAFFFLQMTTITRAIPSKIEAIEIHPDRSRWSEALSEWKGPAVGFRDVTEEINMPLQISGGSGTLPVIFCPWIVANNENWMTWRGRNVVMATEAIVVREPGRGSFCLAHQGVLICVASCCCSRAEYPARWRSHSLHYNPPFSKQTYKESWALVSGLSMTLSMATHLLS